ncbi:MAG: GGDEF domain-containing protein [Candidatus Nanopelagicales bacterium]
MAKWSSWAFAGLMLVIAVVDILLPEEVLLPIMWVPVVASAAFAIPRRTGLLIVWGLLLTLGLFYFDDYVINADYWIRLIGLILIGVLALYLARVAEQRESLLQERSLTDPLTGLPNRRWMYDRLDILLDQRSRDRSVAVLVIALDGLKAVNTMGGHAQADAALVADAQRFSACVGAGDVVHRSGDNEFVVVCPDLADKQEVSALCSQLIESSHLRALDEAGFNLDATIGALVIPPGVSMTSDDAVRQASALVTGLKITCPGSYIVEFAEANVIQRHP